MVLLTDSLVALSLNGVKQVADERMDVLAIIEPLQINLFLPSTMWAMYGLVFMSSTKIAAVPVTRLKWLAGLKIEEHI